MEHVGEPRKIEVDKLRPYSLDEVYNTIPIEVAEQIDAHQTTNAQEQGVLDNFWPKRIEGVDDSPKSTEQTPEDAPGKEPSIEDQYPQVLELLKYSNALYDEHPGVEEALDEDPILDHLYTQTSDSDELTRFAIRARRPIVLRLLMRDQPELFSGLGEGSADSAA